MWKSNFTVVAVVIEALRMVMQNLSNRLEEVEIRGRFKK